MPRVCRWRAGGLAEVGEDAGDDFELIDRVEDAHGPATAGALQNVDGEDAAHQLCPGEATHSDARGRRRVARKLS